MPERCRLHFDAGMVPTLLGLAGLPVPKSMQGVDLSAIVRGETTAGPDAVLLQIFVPFNSDQVPKPWRGIVTADQTYARFESEPWLLFDHDRDPSQLHNLIGLPQHARLECELDAKLTALMQKHGDAWSFNSNELVEEGGRLYRHTTFYSIDEYRGWIAENPDKAK